MLDLQRLRLGRSEEGIVYIPERYKHLLLVGKSGEGKSTFLSNCLQTDFLFKPAIVLIDPSGALSQDAYALSKGKAHYCSLDHPISINPMQLPYNPNVISGIVAEGINQIISVLTPNLPLTAKMRDILDEAVKWCLEHNRRSLLNVRDYIQNLRGDPQTRDGIIARLNFLLNDERLTKILCGNNSVKVGELAEKRESFILSCLGMTEEQMIFSGTISSQLLKSYFRYERPNEYSPLVFYVDECHLFLSPNFFSILKEGRRAKLSCVLATQDFALIEKRTERLMLNVGNIVSFRVGHNEAQRIAPELGMKPEDLQFLEKWHVAYMTPKGRGICKVSPPPFIKRIELKVEVQSKSSGWFPLESYQPA